MKLTESMLRQIIKEELQTLLSEEEEKETDHAAELKARIAASKKGSKDAKKSTPSSKPSKPAAGGETMKQASDRAKNLPASKDAEELKSRIAASKK